MSLPRQIASILETEIRSNYKPDSMIPSQRELSERFGVSVLTVREAVQCLMQEGLVERRHGSGTYVLEQPAPEKWVAVLMENDIGQPHISYAHRRIFQQVRRLVAEAGFQTHGYLGFRSAGEYSCLSCTEFLHDLKMERISAVVSISARLPVEMREDLQRRGIPCIGGGSDGPRMASDICQLVRMGTRYLIGSGRKRLALVGWVDPVASVTSPCPLIQTFQKEIQQAGLSFQSEWIRTDLHPQWLGAGWEEFREIWRGSSEKPDGLLVSDDVLSQDVTVAIMELGIRVPEQLMVVTHSTRGSGIWHPFPVTKVEFDPDALARVFAEMIVKLLRGESVPEAPIILDYELIPMAEVVGNGPKSREEDARGALSAQAAGAAYAAGRMN